MNRLTVGTQWTLSGKKDGATRQAMFEVISKDGLTTLAVAPGQSELMSNLVENIIQPNITNPNFTLRDFHTIVQEEFDETIDNYADVKPDLIQLDPEEVNPFEEVADEVSKPIQEEKPDKEPLKDMDWGRTSKRRNKGNKKNLEAQRKLKDKYQKINISEERSWFEGKFNVPFITVKGLVSVSNYGEFRQLADVVVSEMAIQWYSLSRSISRSS